MPLIPLPNIKLCVVPVAVHYSEVYIAPDRLREGFDPLEALKITYLQTETMEGI